MSAAAFSGAADEEPLTVDVGAPRESGCHEIIRILGASALLGPTVMRA